MSIRVYKPGVFQGNLRKKNYFEGWYFKHVSRNLQQICAFIPGVSITSHNPHSFIQVIDGTDGKTQYISFPLEEFKWDKKRLFVQIGDSVFTDKFIDLKIKTENLNVSGHVEYSNIINYPRKLLAPGIMGWYSFVPFMECKHGVVSVNHDLRGSITINGNVTDLNGGNGYIEKDWGTSFPEAWLWIHSNNFSNSKASFTFSLAKIPWLGRFFIGFITFFYLDGRFYLFSTYNRSVISEIEHDSRSIALTLKNNTNMLSVKVTRNNFGELRAPASGDMSRRIKESMDSTLELSLSDNKGNTLYSGTSGRAGLEVIEEIFSYL